MRSKSKWCLGFVFILLSVSIGASGETVVEKSFMKLREKVPQCAESFYFVIVGDTQPGEPHEFSDYFFRMIEEWNLLNPLFVASVGDMILGGAVEGLDEQWTEFEGIIGKLQVPFFPAPGNHDISDVAS